MTETILVSSEIKEARAPKLTEFETSEVVGTSRFYLLSVTVLTAVTKSALILRSNYVVKASSGEAARVRGVHKEASGLGFVFPGGGEDTGLARGGSSQHSRAGEGEIEHAWVGEKMKQLLDIQRLPAGCLNDIL